MAKSFFENKPLRDFGFDLNVAELGIVIGAIFLIGRLVFHVW
jgi:hypothetical protein